MQPTVRAGLLVEATADEVVVVDEETNEVFSLDPVAASVFTHADGSRDVTELVAVLRASVEPAASAELVWSTLDHLGDAGLLVGRVTPPGGASQVDRRSVLRKGAAGTAAIGAGVVFTALIPSAAAAASDPQSQEEQAKISEEETGKASAEQEAKTVGEQAAKEQTDKAQEQGQKIGQELSDKAAEQGSKNAQEQTDKITQEQTDKAAN